MKLRTFRGYKRRTFADVSLSHAYHLYITSSMSSNAAMPAPPGATASPGTVFSESDPTVLIAYFLAFGIWTFASGNDFISSTWKTVRETRRRGKLHVACVCLPMIYISVYIYFQHKNEDYKEMGAALLALAFALLHLVRTFMGLWQLHMFKQWTMSSINSMESLGYETRLFDNDPNDPDGSDSDDEIGDHDSDCRVSHDQERRLPSLFQFFRSGTVQYEGRGRIERIADDILVNENLIDNRLSDVHTVCHFRLFSEAERKIVGKTKNELMRLWLMFRFAIVNTLLVVRVLFSLAFMGTPRVPNAKSGPHIVPRRPESVWLHWATALVAQLGWMLDENVHVDPDSGGDYEQHRFYFAEQVLLSAAFHTQRIGSFRSASTSASRERDSIPGCLPFDDWHKYPKLCSGQFCKQEFLKRACKTGNGLPYHVAHPHAVERRGSAKRYGYGNFASELRRACEALPPNIEARLESFNVDKLERFAIYVSIENWTPRDPSMEEDSLVSSKTRNESDDSNSSMKSVQGGIKEEYAESENDIPVENLKKQLGLVKQPKFMLADLGLPYFGIVPKFLWGNRNVLEISCHVDNWIALCSGQQTSYTVEHIPWMKAKLNLENTRVVDFAGSTEARLETDRMMQENSSFEKCKTYCQMVTLHPEYCHFEKSISFLGCSMEMLRTSLAKWTEAHEYCNEQCWRPLLFSHDGTHEGGRRRDLRRFKTSPDFTACLRSLKCPSDLSKRFVKMRTLWELQNIFQNYLQQNGAAPSSIEAISLCILSFPAVSMEVRQAENFSEAPEVVQGREESAVDIEYGNVKQFRIQNYEYVIRAACGPQPLEIILSFQPLVDCESAAVSTYLSEAEDSHVASFDWEAWRNAFYCRLEACRQWKEKLGFPNFAPIRSKESINSGIRKVSSTTLCNLRVGTGTVLHVWSGWLQHLPSICLYEITTEGLIQEARERQSAGLEVNLTEEMAAIVDIPQELWVPVDYCEANAESLKNASLQAQQLLIYGSRLPNSGIPEDIHAEVESFLETLSEEGNQSLAMLVLESRAIKQGDAVALRRAISMLLLNGRKSVTRGVKLLERFYTAGTAGKQMKLEASQCDQDIAQFFGNDEYVSTVTSLFEEVFKASQYDRVVAKRYYLFLLSLMKYGRTGDRQSALAVMLRSIAYSRHAVDISDAAASIMDLCSSLSHQDLDDFAVLNLGLSTIGNAADQARKRIPSTRRTSRLVALGDIAKYSLATAIGSVAAVDQGMASLQALRLSRYTPVEIFEEAVQDEEDSSTSIVVEVVN